MNTYTQTHVHTYTRTHIRIHAYTRTHTHIHTYTFTHILIRACTHTHITRVPNACTYTCTSHTHSRPNTHTANQMSSLTVLACCDATHTHQRSPTVSSLVCSAIGSADGVLIAVSVRGPRTESRGQFYELSTRTYHKQSLHMRRTSRGLCVQQLPPIARNARMWLQAMNLLIFVPGAYAVHSMEFTVWEEICVPRKSAR